MSSSKPTIKNAPPPRRKSRKGPSAVLKALSVAGYKSVGEAQRIDVRPLTLLAGANSGGKSSLVQPMLLLKQTLDAPYDPGSLLLDGPNVRLTSTDQLFTRHSKAKSAKSFQVGFDLGDFAMELTFDKAHGRGLEVRDNIIRKPGEAEIVLNMEMTQDVRKNILASSQFVPSEMLENAELRTSRDRCFIAIDIIVGGGRLRIPYGIEGNVLATFLRQMIHLPGLRGNPERTYKTTAVGDTFPGTFESYVASIIHHWKSTKDDRLTQLGRNLEVLGLTWKVTSQALDDTQVELKVGRLSHSKQGGAQDLVGIADVGFGVSQSLPLLVALLVASPGQVVYLEQPEIHLHPRAQIALAKILAEAAQRGVIVIAETHSALLLQGIQTLVAKDELSQDLVKLHWVQRDEMGMTQVKSADLDNAGAFGDWPVDFMEVGLEADHEYLLAAETKLFNRNL